MRHLICAATVSATALLISMPARADHDTTVTNDNGETIVHAPTTDVEAAHDGSEVTVDAPYTYVQVDKKKRTVKIRVPYFNEDIQW